MQENLSHEVCSQDEIRACVLDVLQKYHARSAMLFGSYARQEATPSSDIDLVIFGGADFDPTDVFAIADELYDRLHKKVDVYEVREINRGTDFYDTIMREGVQIA